MTRPMKSCDFAQRLQDERIAFSARMKELEESIGEPVHFYTNRERSISDALKFERSLQKYGLLKPSKWIETAD